ncbi:MAG: hypothetical protein OSA96_18970, partial [Aurantimonas coralicida]|nr:hypothetical protein [Aurantimonas coralicida]
VACFYSAPLAWFCSDVDTLPRTVKGYDKLGYRHLLSNFRYYWFGNKPFTKAKVEAFFSDTSNFNNP